MNRFFKCVADTFMRCDNAEQPMTFAGLFRTFKKILELNNKILERMADMGDKLSGDYVFDRQYIVSSCRKMGSLLYELIYNINTLTPGKYRKLDTVFREINNDIQEELSGRIVIPQSEYIIPYDQITGDSDDVVGGKNTHIGQIRNRLGLTVPEGFAITTRAFQSFFDGNGYEQQLALILKAWKEKRISSAEASRKVTDMISRGILPPALARAIKKAAGQLHRKVGGARLFLAIRSSAMGEDSELSFAGQYLSLLNEPKQNILQSYKKILAGAYTHSALEYRRQKGFSEQEVAMAVACQCMVDAKVSGVLYTLDPVDPDREVMVISAAWGLGAPIVEGKVAADRFVVSREFPHTMQGVDIVRKPDRFRAKPEGGCEFVPVEAEMQTRMSLTDAQIQDLAEAALGIERYFKCPQDIEWAFDQQDRLVILQARSLNISPQMQPVTCDISSVTGQYTVLFSNKGTIVQSGIGTGKVFLVQSDGDLDHFPNGAVLVARNTSPRYAKVARKASGIITDVGSSTGHMAAIAREFRIPSIVNTEVATKILKTGQEITLDAQENVVYAGRIKELCYLGFMEDDFEESVEYRLLRRVLRKITPLNLVDPHAKNFTPGACRSFHDIARFIHEKAVQELIDLNYNRRLQNEPAGKKLDLDIPIDLVVIDIEGGLREVIDEPKVTRSQIKSLPMAAFIDGLRSPGAWSRDPMPVDFSSFMSSLTRTYSSHAVNPRFGQNLAVISDAYANISLRLGYHFNMIDAYISEHINDNYAYFRFLGGVTDPIRRSRRAQFIHDTLAQFDFNVDLRGDLVIGRIKKLGMQSMQKKMFLLGQLVGFTRQLDVKMISDQQIGEYIEAFNHLANTVEHTNALERETP